MQELPQSCVTHEQITIYSGSSKSYSYVCRCEIPGVLRKSRAMQISSGNHDLDLDLAHHGMKQGSICRVRSRSSNGGSDLICAMCERFPSCPRRRHLQTLPSQVIIP